MHTTRSLCLRVLSRHRLVDRFGRRGATVVEFAVVLPLLLMIVMGIIEFGRAMMIAQVVTNAARHGARLAIVDGSDNSSVEDSIETFLIDAAGIEAGDAGITIEVTPGPGNPDPADDLTLAQSTDLVMIQVTIPYSKVGWVTGDYLGGVQLAGQCTMRHE